MVIVVVVVVVYSSINIVVVVALNHCVCAYMCTSGLQLLIVPNINVHVYALASTYLAIVMVLWLTMSNLVWAYMPQTLLHL